MKLKVLSAVAMALALGTSAQAATNLVQNGGFEQGPSQNTQFGADFGGQVVTGWTGLGGNHLQFYYNGGTQTTQNAVNQFNDPQAFFHSSFNALSSNGGSFIGLDGDGQYAGQVSQTINGLVAGQQYSLDFQWAAGQLANRTGATTEQLAVSLGGDTQLTSVLSNASEGFSGWKDGHFVFTATAASETLTFLSMGTPDGLPPIAALDGVSLTAVPEPATWAMMLIGFGGLGAVLRRRRFSAVAA